MSSDTTLEVTLKSLWRSDCAGLILLTIVGYDYVLTFSDEVEYIWTRTWTWVSTLFTLVRYPGLYFLVIVSLSGSGFIPSVGSLCVSISSPVISKRLHSIIISHVNSECRDILITAPWAFLVFIGAADLTMILRVWAMYNRSRLILRILIVSFSLDMIFGTFLAAMSSDPEHWSVSFIKTFDTSICTWSWRFPILTVVANILQMTHTWIVSVLGTVQFVRVLLQGYHVTKQWQVNRYMNLLVKQGILYFIAILLFNVIEVLAAFVSLPLGGWRYEISLVLGLVPAFALSPRFIMSIRKMYARGGNEIDTGFGLPSSRGGAGTAIMFADVEQTEEMEGVEEIPLERGQTWA